MKTALKYISILLSVTLISCSETIDDVSLKLSDNVLDFTSLPESPDYRESLVFSDQGAWFGYGLDSLNGGFSGPFLMTQENGTWISSNLNKLTIYTDDSIQVRLNLKRSVSNLIGLEQELVSENISLLSHLFFIDSKSAVTRYRLMNISDKDLNLTYMVEGSLINPSVYLKPGTESVNVYSLLSNTKGNISYSVDNLGQTIIDSSNYKLIYHEVNISSGDEIIIELVNSFYNSDTIIPAISDITSEQIDSLYALVEYDKLMWLVSIRESLREGILDNDECNVLVNKSLMTLQNNWRSASGELNYDGLFPSYHYYWFHGFWAWDSWKHAYALAEFYPELAKKQVLAMFEFMDEDGFIADCIYRDTLIENHNLRNTKPPLSAWAVWNIFQNDSDTGFLKIIYPSLTKQHYWWYYFRDIDNDGICEYGSTDGTLVAAKWESGMDNAVRFDNSQILLNKTKAYSLDQESVDLNSYLYAEKIVLSKIANVLGNEDEARFITDADKLKSAINDQFFDNESGWYYDTSLDGNTFVKTMGCEGWIPLWAEVASAENASKVRANMLDTTRFNVHIPLQTLSADNPKFKPQRGYWRGPVWLDQAYFGIVGLRNYGYNSDADILTEKLLQNSAGLLIPGPSIRENYNPITGKGMEAENFSWSAAHFLLLIME